MAAHIGTCRGLRPTQPQLRTGRRAKSNRFGPCHPARTEITDVLLAALRKQAPAARVVVLVTKKEAGYVPLLAERFPLHAVLTLPVAEADMEAVFHQP